ncbi:hypothetical protein ABPG75_013637 [Micractinium tetrahymenae]
MRSTGASRDSPRHQQRAAGPSDSSGTGAATGPVTQLPLLPLFDHVLLPGGFLRVTIPASWRKSAALVEELLQAQEGEVVVAAVPYLTGGAAAAGGSRAAAALQHPPGDPDELGAGADPQLDLDRLYSTGTAARVLQLTRRTASGGWVVTLEGRCRLRVLDVRLASRPPRGELYEASVEQLDYLAPGRPAGGRGGGAGAGAGALPAASTKEQEELSQELLKGTRRLFLLIQGEPEGREAAARVARALAQQGPARMSDVLGSLVARALRDRLSLLASLDVTARLQLVVDLLGQMLEVAEKAAAGGGVRGGGRSRRGLGAAGVGRGLRLPGLAGEDDDDEEDGKQELAAIMQKLKDANPPPEVLRAAQREFKRLQRGSEQHPGYSMSLTYLETLADLPWSRLSSQAGQPQHPGAAATPVNGDEEEDAAGHVERGRPERAQHAAPPAPATPLPLAAVRQRLDDAHYGLDKIKERIVQYVAVQRLRGWDARAPILCFIGPPGVGKTSLARSIAEVLGRPFQRISLGGVRDEAEIRGHRRTYIGAMPGRLIQAVRKAGVRDPLLLLDEVDKMGRDARGDPAAALLEVLDPEQNSAFVDTYLGLPFDLSSALFVATANRAADIPAPLLDRLEVVQLGGYTLEEKVHIAERHLIPRLLAEHGLHQGQLVFPPDAVRSIIEGYTAEAGVRSLSRCLAAVCRHVAVQVVQQREQQQQQGGMADALALPEGLGSGAHRGLPPPPLLPELPHATAAKAAAAAAASSGQQLAAMPAAPHAGSLRSRLGDLQVHQPDTLTPAGRVRLWLELLPLSTLDPATGGPSSGAAAAVSSAVSGYPWRQLRTPLHSKRSSSKAAAAALAAGAPKPATDCACASRKQTSGWFSWLCWARHDSHAEQAGIAEPEAAAAGACACAGGCGDADCCCNGSLRRRQLGNGPAAGWGEPGEAGTAADSASWEASWRSAARRSSARHSVAAEAAPLLCGPGSMQVLPSPAPAGLRLAARPAVAFPAAAGAGAGLQQQRQQAQQQQQVLQEESLPKEEVPGGLLVAETDLPAAPQGPQEQQQQIVVDAALVEAVLGPRRYEGHNSAERVAAPGTAAGLVWTAVGGKVQYIECICVGAGRAGRPGQLTLTGQLGDVLEESARIALSWVRAHAAALGLRADASCPSRKWDVHIHLPAGAVPKDGPSAGVTLATALVSLFTGKCVRADAAMTGELTLRGLVLPVGGIKEKLLAAQAAGMARVLVPARNMPDVRAEVPAAVREALQVLPCQRLEDVLRGAFDPPLELQPELAVPQARL